MLAISILGNSPLTAEMVQRRDDRSVVVHVYQAPAGCALDDSKAWASANPGIEEGIKSLSYMGRYGPAGGGASFRTVELQVLRPESDRESGC